MTVDLSRSISIALKKARQRVSELIEKRRAADAAKACRECARLARRYAEFAVTEGERRRRRQEAQTHDTLAERLQREGLSDASWADRSRAAPAADASEYASVVEGLIHRSAVTWDEIGGLDELKQDIRSAYALSLAKRPDGVDLDACRRILLYGPPGTGKTLIAAATSSGLDATFFNVKVGDVLSKYFGESPKLISSLYSAAQRQAPSVVFLDEFDALAASRDTSDSGAERRVLAQILAEMDGLSEKKDRRYVLTLAATNAPWLLDQAVLSRFEKKVYVPLPDEPTRRQILTIHLTRRGHRLECDIADLASLTAGLSGREIVRLCDEAVAQMIAEVNPGLHATADAGRDAACDYQLRVRSLRPSDFRRLRRRLVPATGSQDLDRYEGWRQSG